MARFLEPVAFDELGQPRPHPEHLVGIELAACPAHEPVDLDLPAHHRIVDEAQLAGRRRRLTAR